MQFTAYGHPNIRATHKTTIEFTKDQDLSLKGDCITGVNANFDVKVLKDFIKQNKDKKIRIILAVDDLKEEIIAELNPFFDDSNEVIIRKSDFVSKRTFAIKADKAAFDIDKRLINKLKNLNKKIIIKYILISLFLA